MAVGDRGIYSPQFTQTAAENWFLCATTFKAASSFGKRQIRIAVGQSPINPARTPRRPAAYRTRCLRGRFGVATSGAGESDPLSKERAGRSPGEHPGQGCCRSEI